MGEMGLQRITQYSKRDYQKEKRLAKKQNVLQRKFQVDEPNRIWVSDVTCFDIYLSVQSLIFSRGK